MTDQGNASNMSQAQGAALFNTPPLTEEAAQRFHQRQKQYQESGIHNLVGLREDVGSPAKSILRQRAAALRNAAQQLETLADMTPEVLSDEQEAALMFIAQGAQLAV